MLSLVGGTFLSSLTGWQKDQNSEPPDILMPVRFGMDS